MYLFVLDMFYLDEECDNIEHWEKAYTTIVTVANSSDIHQVISYTPHLFWHSSDSTSLQM